jgi:hypothetical protein
MTSAAEWVTRADGSGFLLADAGPRMWLPWQILDDLVKCMPLFPVVLVSADFAGCPAGRYEPEDGAVGAVLRFAVTDGRQLVYRIVRSDFARMAYECAWPD